MSRGQKVFVVDDDDAVRESLSALLISYGFETVTFEGARDFLAQCDRAATGCLIADVRMPDIGGLELQERVAAEFPQRADGRVLFPFLRLFLIAYAR